MSMQMWFVVIAIALIILVPIIASSVICVPKWWDQRVVPHLPGWWDAPPPPAPDISAWYFAPLRWVGAVIRFLFVIFVGVPLFFVAGGCARYCYAWTSWIERRCPYTPAETAANYDSQQQEAARFHKDWMGSFGNLWKTAIGRDG